MLIIKFSLSIVFSVSLILLNWFLSSLHNVFSGIASLTVNFCVIGFKTSKAPTCFLPYSSIVLVCFSNALLSEEHVNLVCYIILFWSDGNISSPVRYSYLPILPADNADVFTASLLISYCNFSPLILSSNVMVSFYIVSTRFFLKHKRLYDERVVLITKKEYSFAVHFL